MLSFVKLVAFLGIASIARASQCQQAHVVGSDHNIDLSTSVSQPFSYIIRQEDATYIAPHFSSLNLPAGGSIEISSLDGSQKITYTGASTEFYSEYIRGSEAIITYYPPEFVVDEVDTVAFTIDRFAAGFPPEELDTGLESVCGADNSKPAACLKSSDAAKYQKSRAVGRLFIGGSSLCTGWLFGSEGHLITNNHCIGSASAANNVQFEFGAECASCTDPNNSKQLGCPGETVATSAKFIYTNAALDFTLVKLNLKSGVNLSKYGYLQARSTAPTLNEQIYIAQHPAGKPRRIATVVDSGSVGTVEKLSINTCSNDEIGYSLDTEGGSSGSPVLSVKSNVVVALHNCGGCLNGGIKINAVVAKLKSLGYLPANSVVGAAKFEDLPSNSTEN